MIECGEWCVCGVGGCGYGVACILVVACFFFFNDTATTEIYTE